MTTPFIQGIGLANPPRRFSQDDTFQMAGYTSPRILEIFRNCDIDYRQFFSNLAKNAMRRRAS